jgi:transcriptional regulator with XRE-family HTH domain
MVDSFSKQVATWRAQHPLRLYLDEKDITQADLAALLGVTRMSVSAWLTGTRIKEQHLEHLRKMTPQFDEKVQAWREASPLNEAAKSL